MRPQEMERELERLRQLWRDLAAALGNETLDDAATIQEGERLAEEALRDEWGKVFCPACRTPDDLHLETCPLAPVDGPFRPGPPPPPWTDASPRIFMDLAAHVLQVCWHLESDCPEHAVALGSGVYVRCGADYYPAGILFKFTEMAEALGILPPTPGRPFDA